MIPAVFSVMATLQLIQLMRVHGLNSTVRPQAGHSYDDFSFNIGFPFSLFRDRRETYNRHDIPAPLSVVCNL